MVTLREQAIAYIKAGNTEKGRQLLLEVLRQNPGDENAWLWMTEVVNTDDERIRCLQYALDINPNNEYARHGLAQLQEKQAPQKPAPPPTKQVVTELPRTQEVGPELPPAQEVGTKPPPIQQSETKQPQFSPQPARQVRIPGIIWTALAVLGLISVGGGLFFLNSLIPATNSIPTGPAYLTPATNPAKTAYPVPTTRPTGTLPPVPTVTAATTLSIAAATCIPNNPPQTGKVVGVIDGGTIKVLLDQDGMIYSVRYIGVDTPESTIQAGSFGSRATARNTELVAGRTVTLIKDASETDQYGRLLRYVLVDDAFVNYELVAQGYAKTAAYPPDVACMDTFRAAEQTAAAAQLGLWAAPALTP